MFERTGNHGAGVDFIVPVTIPGKKLLGHIVIHSDNNQSAIKTLNSYVIDSKLI